MASASQKEDDKAPGKNLSPSERLELARKRRVQQLKHYEIYEKQRDKVIKLGRRKQQKNVKFPGGIKLLAGASRKDTSEVENILRSGANPNEGNEDGITALHQSAIDNSIDIVALLIKHKANVNVRDREMWTPLHAASACGNKDVCKLLLDSGADLLAMNGDGNMPYDICEHQETLDYIEGEMLRRNITQEEIDGRRSTRETNMLIDVKNIIISHGRIPSYVGPEGETLLHIGASNGFANVTEVLLDNGAKIDVLDNDWWQPIHCAVHWGQFQVAEILLRRGADLNVRTRNGLTALDMCINENVKKELMQIQEEYNKHLPRKPTHMRNSKSSTSTIKRSGDRGTISSKDQRAEGEELRVNIHKYFANEDDEDQHGSSKTMKTKASDGKQRRRSSTTFFNSVLWNDRSNPSEEDLEQLKRCKVM